MSCVRPAPTRRSIAARRTSLLALTTLMTTLVAAMVLPGCGGRRGRKRTTPVAAATASAETRRDVWQKPSLVAAKMGLLPGMSVADIGSGSGYMLPHLSRAVGAKGRVYAVEIDKTLVVALKRRIAKAKLRNVVVVTGAVEDLPLTTLVDRVLLLNTYPELERPVAMLKAMRQRLKPTGRLVIIDYKADPLVAGPPPEERLSLETIIAEARGAGFVESLQFNVLPRQYFALFINHEEAASGDALDGPDAPTPTDASAPTATTTPTVANSPAAAG